TVLFVPLLNNVGSLSRAFPSMGVKELRMKVWGITDMILPLIEKCCFGLSDLNLKHCQGLSQKSINLFESRLWKCNVLSL
ncbi:hypothetical protein GOP47_0022605, partial [Adiantum capillus-veneris]